MAIFNSYVKLPEGNPYVSSFSQFLLILEHQLGLGLAAEHSVTQGRLNPEKITMKPPSTYHDLP